MMTGSVCYFSVTVIQNTLTKMTYREQDLFGLTVPEGEPIMAGMQSQEAERSHIFPCKHKPE